jgi:hypothetical protein
MKDKGMKNSKLAAYRSPIALFSLVFTSVSVITFCIQTFRGQNNSESIDKVVFLTGIGLGAYFLGKAYFAKQIPTVPTLLSIVTILISVIGIVGIEKHPTMDPKFLSTIWLGFGWPVLIATIATLPFVLWIVSESYKQLISRVILRVISFAVLLAAIPAMLQGGASIIDPYHSEYVINELLAVSAGNIPYVDFIPQYGQLYSWMIAPLASFASADTLVTVGLYLMSLATFAALGIGVWVLSQTFASKSISLAIIAIVPITSIAQFPGRESYAGTIYDLLSAIPVRIFPGMFIALITLNLVFRSSPRKWLLISVGLINGLSVWVNQDFAIAAAIVSTFLLMTFVLTRIQAIVLLAGILVGIIIYPLTMAFFGHWVRFDSIGFFVLQYTSGFMAEPISTPGPVLIVFPLIIALTTASLLPLLKHRKSKDFLDSSQYKSLMTSQFFSLWSLIGFVYYLNRSYASGQMQILFLPLAIALFSFANYALSELRDGMPWLPRTFFRKSTWGAGKSRAQFSYLSFGIVLALGLSTLVAFPRPDLEIGRLQNALPTHMWPFASTKNAIERIDLAKRSISPEKIGYLGNSGNYVEIVTGVESVNVLNSPWDMPPAPVPLKVGCDFILKSGQEYLVLDEIGYRVKELFASKNLCENFSEATEIPEISPYLLKKIGG